jgi:hypothetical protein
VRWWKREETKSLTNGRKLEEGALLEVLGESDTGSREKAILGEAGRHQEDVVLGNTGRRRDEARSAGEEAPSAGEAVK